MTIFANALATIKATDTTDVSATSLQVAAYDVFTRVAMAQVTASLDRLSSANIEGWYQVEEAMLFESADFIIKVEGNHIEVAITLPKRNADVDMRILTIAMESYIKKWAPIRPVNLSLDLVLCLGSSSLSVFENFRPTLEERKALKEQA